MAKSKAQRMKEYRTRKKQQFGNKNQDRTRGPRGPWNAHLRQKIFKSSLFSLLFVQQVTPGRSKSEGHGFKN